MVPTSSLYGPDTKATARTYIAPMCHRWPFPAIDSTCVESRYVELIGPAQARVCLGKLQMIRYPRSGAKVVPLPNQGQAPKVWLSLYATWRKQIADLETYINTPVSTHHQHHTTPHHHRTPFQTRRDGRPSAQGILVVRDGLAIP